MNKRAEKVEVAVEDLKDAAPADDRQAVILETEAKVDGEHHDTSIEVRQEDIPAMAAALLNAQNEGVSANDVSAPVLRCLGAGVVHWLSDESVRFSLQFDSGQVLPIEMSKPAALALCRGLFERTGAAAGFEPAKWGVGS